jgi:hypothetical protein
LDRLQLKEDLKKDVDIKAIGGICHHRWNLSAAMKKKLRKILLASA